MTEQEFDLLLEQSVKAFGERYIDLPDEARTYTYEFSPRFEKKMQRLIRRERSFCYPLVKTPVRRLVTIAVTALLFLFLMGAALVTYRLWDHYQIEDYGLYSLLNIDGGNFPTELKERYEIGADMSGFSENVLTDESFNYWIEYKSADGIITINFEQYVKDAVQNMLLNTENAVDKPTETEINGHQGVFFQTRYDNMVLIWDVGDYIISLSATGVGKNELFSLAESVQKVES